MAEIKINIDNLEAEITKLKTLSESIASKKEKCPETVGGGSSIQQLENIGIAYGKIHEQIATLVANTADFMKSVRDETVKMDNQIASDIGRAPCGNNISITKEEVAWVTGESNEIVTSSGATKYRQPAYTQIGLEPVNGIYENAVRHRDGTIGYVSYYNDPDTRTQLSCTYYTVRKLNERGLAYPCKGGPGSGANWYGNFDTESGLKSYGGNNALYELVGGLSLPQENIVVSFASNTGKTEDFRKHGHVMLIDKIYMENGEYWVQYNDTYDDVNKKIVSGINDTNDTRWKTLDDFMSYYNRYNGAINGIVVMGAGNK